MLFAELAEKRGKVEGVEESTPKPVNLFGGGGGGGGVQLQKKAPPKEFTEHDFSSYLKERGISATTRLRFLDSSRLHTPLNSECARLNIPNSRINVLVLKDVLYLSGGLTGARFSSEDLASIKSIVQTLSGLWTTIERLYAGLSAADKKHPWAEDPSANPPEVNEFFSHSNDFIRCLAEIQGVVKRVQDSIDPNVKFDNTDPESKIGSMMPEFLTILITKFNGGVPMEGKPANFTVGRLSVFLSTLVTGSNRASLGLAESGALSELIQASNDSQNCLTNADMSHLSASLPAMDQKYWARRFFNFLSCMTELKTTPKDEKFLESVN